MNIKVDEYLKKFPLCIGTPLGVNVSKVLELAKKKNCKPSELTEEDIKSLK